MQSVATSENEEGGRATALATTLSFLVAWFLAIVWLGVRGAFSGGGGPPIGLALALLVPLAVFALDTRLRGPLFEGLRRFDLAGLIALQTYRVGGVFFLVAWMAGDLPGAFALPAGIGDVVIGAAAPFVAAAVAARRPGHRALAVAWNVLGLIDLVSALFLGVSHSPPPYGFLAGSVTSAAVTHYPLSLIPTFGVPLALILHIAALRRISSPRH